MTSEHTGEEDAGRFVVEVWGADVGHGELLAMVSDALKAREIHPERLRVSYVDNVTPSGSDHTR